MTEIKEERLTRARCIEIAIDVSNGKCFPMAQGPGHHNPVFAEMLLNRFISDLAKGHTKDEVETWSEGKIVLYWGIGDRIQVICKEDADIIDQLRKPILDAQETVNQTLESLKKQLEEARKQ